MKGDVMVDESSVMAFRNILSNLRDKLDGRLRAIRCEFELIATFEDPVKLADALGPAKSPWSQPIAALGLPSVIANRLVEYGLPMIGWVANFIKSNHQLTDIKGIGPVKAKIIEEALGRFVKKYPQPEEDPDVDCVTKKEWVAAVRDTANTLGSMGHGGVKKYLRNEVDHFENDPRFVGEPFASPFEREMVDRMHKYVVAAIRGYTVDSSIEPTRWSAADTPKRWAKQYGFSERTLKRRFKDGKIRCKMLSDRRYQIHIDDLPAPERR